MSNAGQIGAARKLGSVLTVLRARDIPFQGPFVTPKRNRIYLVDGCILTETEIVKLHGAGNFDPERVQSFLRNLRSTQSPRPYNPEPHAGPFFRNRRRSERIMLQFNLLVRLETSKGRPLQTHAFTVVVNANGGQLRSPFRMTVEQNITLVNPETGKEVGCRVVGVDRTADIDYLVYYFMFVQPDPSFWPTTHPSRMEAKS